MAPERRSRRELLASAAAIGTVATAGCLTGSLFGGNRGSIQAPAQTTVGDPLRVRLSDFEPETSVTLDFVANDARGRTFEGSWSLRTDSHGEATLSTTDLTANAPKSTWYGSEGGLQVADRSKVDMILHRLSSAGLFSSPSNFVMGDRTRAELAFRARSGLLERSEARDSQRRVLIDPGISRQPVETNGLVGWLYEPSTSGPHPPVLTLHGSNAAVPHRLSKMLATQGYATLALQYFHAPGLPESLKEIPLEYFDRAIQWLTHRPAVRDGRIGVLGISRGVEAALLTAANYDGPATVIGYSGGGVVGHGVAGVPPRAFIGRPAWTRNGKPVAGSDPVGIVFDAVKDTHQHRCEIESLPDSIRSRVPDETLQRVLVPVEDIDGPVLLLAGVDDREWPSAPVSALTISRLQRRDYSHPYGLRAYCNAGHVFGMPYADYTGSPSNDERGGTSRANARAAANSWPLVLDYLDRGLKQEA